MGLSRSTASPVTFDPAGRRAKGYVNGAGALLTLPKVNPFAGQGPLPIAEVLPW